MTMITIIPKIQQNLSSVHPLESDNYRDLTLRYRRVKFLSTELAAWIVWIIHLTIIFVFLFAFLPTSDPIEIVLKGETTSFGFARVGIMALEMVTAILLLLFLIPVKSMDNYNITFQIQLLTFFTGIILFLAVIIFFLPSSTLVDALQGINDAILPLVLVSINLVVPIWPERWALQKGFRFMMNKTRESIVRRRQSSVTGEMRSIVSGTGKSMSKPRSELDDILDDPSAVEELKAFMIKEICLENLLFINAVAGYKADSDFGSPAQVMQRAKAVFDEYIERGALNEVNLPVDCYKKTKELVQSMESRSNFGEEFDEADKHIRYLIQTDTLRRFKIGNGRNLGKMRAKNKTSTSFL